MKKTTLLMALPAAAALALGGCGGSDTSVVPVGNYSITVCFTANSAVNLALPASNVPSGQTAPTRSITEPRTYNGQAVTGQTFFYPSGNVTYVQAPYWSVTNSGVIFIANVYPNGTATPDGIFPPANTSPDQTRGDGILIGFETISLAGKMFLNACHLRGVI